MTNRFGAQKRKKTISWTILKPYMGWILIQIPGCPGEKLIFLAKAWLDVKNNLVSWKAYWKMFDLERIDGMTDKQLINVAEAGIPLIKDVAIGFFPELASRARYRT